MVRRELLPEFRHLDAAAGAMGAGDVLDVDLAEEGFAGYLVGPLEEALAEIPRRQSPYPIQGFHVGGGAQVVVLLHLPGMDDPLVEGVVDFAVGRAGKAHRQVAAHDDGLEAFRSQDGAESKPPEVPGGIDRRASDRGEPFPGGPDPHDGHLSAPYLLSLPKDPVGGRGRLPPEGAGRLEKDLGPADREVTRAIQLAGDDQCVDSRFPEGRGEAPSGVGLPEFPGEG